MKQKIGFLGFGHLAQIMFKALGEAKVFSHSQVVFHQRDAAKSKLNEQKFGISATSLEHLVQISDVIFLCVRPQDAEVVFRDLRSFKMGGKWVVSVLVGTPLSKLEKGLGTGVQILRAMPNIASEFHQGMTILTPGSTCDVEFKSFANIVFGSLGQVSVMPESMMDVCSAIAGSGPGFVLRLIDAMARVGVQHGISEQEALKIAAQTFLGAAHLVMKGAKPSELLVQIATPNGATAAGFEVMSEKQVDPHFMMAIEATAARAKALSR
jgi:pyrroline-5-carboxylate reductase